MGNRFMMLNRIVKTNYGYNLYIFGGKDDTQELKNRKNNEWERLKEIFGDTLKITAVSKLYGENVSVQTFDNGNTQVREYPLKEFAREFQKENSAAGGKKSKKLGSKKDTNVDGFVTHYLAKITGDATFTNDDEGLYLTKRLLNSHNTNGIDIDIYDSVNKVVYEFLKRENDAVDNITAHPMRYSWTSNNFDNRKKFIALWEFSEYIQAKIVLVNYSVNKIDSDYVKMIELKQLLPNVGFVSDVEYPMSLNQLQRFMCLTGIGKQDAYLECLPFRERLEEKDFKTGNYKSKLRYLDSQISKVFPNLKK